MVKDKECIISFVIPVYNAEKTIRNCLDSIVSQTCSDITYEIILVNDGSVDRSSEICYEYVNRYKNITIIEQENKGVSTARNVGIQNALGTWIMFVDADDWLDLHLLEVLKERLKEDADVVFFNYKTCASIDGGEIGKEILCDCNYKELTLEQVILATLDYEKIPMVKARFNTPWGKCIRRSVVVDNKIFFEPKIKVAEDFIFDLQVYSVVSKFEYISFEGYYYYVNPQSATRRCRKDMVENNRIVARKLKELESSFVQYDWWEEAYSYSVLKGMLNCLMLQIFNIDNKSRLSGKKKELECLVNSEPYCTAIRSFQRVKKHFQLQHRVYLFFAIHKKAFILDCLVKIKSSTKRRNQ